MITWDRAKFDQRCGRCGHPIAQGAPRLVVTIARVEKVRGECCEGPAPDLPPFVPYVPVPITSTPRRLRMATATLPLDWRRRQAGDDDDGGAA